LSKSFDRSYPMLRGLDHSGIAVAFAAVAIPQPADGDREREDVGYFGIPARRTEW
jgi:hypothetical protein